MMMGLNFLLELRPLAKERRRTRLSVRCRKRTPTRLHLHSLHFIAVRMACISRALMCSPECFQCHPVIHNRPGTLARSRKYLGAGSLLLCTMMSSPFMDPNPKNATNQELPAVSRAKVAS